MSAVTQRQVAHLAIQVMILTDENNCRINGWSAGFGHNRIELLSEMALRIIDRATLIEMAMILGLGHDSSPTVWNDTYLADIVSKAIVDK